MQQGPRPRLTPDIQTTLRGLLAVPQGGGLLSQSPPPPPQRSRGEPGFLTYLLGGSEGLDAERARREAERLRPQLEAQRQQALDSIQDPRERALFLGMGGEDWQKNVGQQFAPQVIAAGGIQSVIGDGRRVGAPQSREFGDRIAITDPLTGQTTYTDPRPMTHSEVTSRDKNDIDRFVANRPIELAPGVIALNRDGSTFGQGAPRVFSAPDATQLYTEDGGMLAENQRDAPPVDPAQANASQARTQSALNAISNTRGAVERARGQVGFWTTGPLSGLPLNTPSRDLNASLDTIKANLSFNELARMRSESPTGGALGSIAVRELDLLGSTVASLDQSQSRGELENSLDVIERSLLRWEATLKIAAGSPLLPHEAAVLPSGTEFLGTDGQRYRVP